MEDPTRTAERAGRLPDTTTVVAMGWVFLTVYGALAASASAPPVSASGWAGAVVTLVVTCAVVQRRRWGRIALMGISAITMVAGFWAIWSLARGAGTAAEEALRGVSFQVEPPSVGDGMAFSIALVILGSFSLVWMLLPAVRGDFERRKREATRRTQLGIAAVLVAVWMVGAAGPAAHSVSHVLSQNAANARARRGATAGAVAVRVRAAGPAVRSTRR